MKFLFPAFLFALLSVVLPVIIHLFSFRRYKTVYFSNVSFLENIKKESQKRSKLKQILILIARILTLVFLVLAFSQPYIPANRETNRQPNQVIAVYIDNSFSMNALSEKGQLLEVARNKALEISLAYPAGTRFRLFTNDLDPKHQHIVNREQFIQLVSGIHPTPSVVPLSVIFNRFAFQDTGDNNNTDKNLYFISDFQRAITDLENFADETVFSYFLPLIPNQVTNLFIDSCWVEVPAHRLNQEETVFVRIKNSSTQDYQNLPLNLYLNDSVKSITNFSVAAQNEITASLNYTNSTAGLQLGKIEITDYPFTHDNNWFISYFVEPSLKALAIYDNSPASGEGLAYISALFANDDFIRFDAVNIQSLQISKLPEYNAIFLINLENLSSGFINEISKATENGSSLVLFPGAISNTAQNNNLLSKLGASLINGLDTTRQEISGIDFDHPFFKNVFKKKEENAVQPQINRHLTFVKNIQTTETNLLWFQNGGKALSVLPFENGKVWVFSFPLDKKSENFARDVLFVPALYNIVLNSLPNQQISLIIGQDNHFTIPKNQKIELNSSIEIENKTNNEKFIPEKTITGRGARIDFGGQITEAGHYLIKNDDQTISALAFNYNRKESDLKYFTPSELKEEIENTRLKNASVVKNADGNFTEVFNEIQNGKQLWKWCILLALFFILSEVLIVRFMK